MISKFKLRIGAKMQSFSIGKVLAAKVIGPTVTPSGYDLMMSGPNFWLNSGLALLRAARALLAQVARDLQWSRDVIKKGEEATSEDMTYANVSWQAAFLAALSVENALKAVIVVGLPYPSTPDGKLPKPLEGHNLETLVTRAKMTFTGPAELEALREGRRFIEGIGRYPGPTNAAHQHVGFVFDPGPLHEAYVRISSDVSRRWSPAGTRSTRLLRPRPRKRSKNESTTTS